jgi:O-antigen ligase
MRRVSFLNNTDTLLSRDEAAVLLVGIISTFVLSTLWFGQSLWLYALMLCGAGSLVFLYPQAGLFAVLVCLMVFEKHFSLENLQLGNTAYKVYPMDFLLFFIGVRLVLFDFKKIITVFQKPVKWLDMPIVFFLVLCSIAYVRGISGGDTSDALAFSTWKNYIGYGIFYLYSIVLLRTEDDWRDCMRWFSYGATAVFFFLVYGLVTGHGLWSEYTPLSTVGERLIAGTHIFYLILFGFWAFTWYLFVRHRDVQKNDTEEGSLLLLLLILVSIGIVVSLVRHLWIAVSCIGVLYILFLPQLSRVRLFTLVRRVLVLTAVVISVYAIFLSIFVGSIPQTIQKGWYVFHERINVSSVVALEDSSFTWRLVSWQQGYRLWQQQPLVGIGFGHMVVFDWADGFAEIPMRDLHNNYLGILVQTGVFGALLVGYWFFSILYHGYHMIKQSTAHSLFLERLLWMGLSSFVLFLISFSVSVYWDINVFIVFFWWILALLRFVSIQFENE